MKRIELFISDEQAWELAQLCKRIGYSDIRALATDDDEADIMMSSVLMLQQSLLEFGYSPR
ncbi:MAG: hypothetical protein WAX67_06770 [Rugosibacter sp.]